MIYFVELTQIEKGTGFPNKVFINMETVRMMAPSSPGNGIKTALHFSDGWICFVRETCDEIIGANTHKKVSTKAVNH